MAIQVGRFVPAVGEAIEDFRTAQSGLVDPELRDIGLKVFTCSTNKITVALGVDDPDDIQERIGIRIHEQFYPPR